MVQHQKLIMKNWGRGDDRHADAGFLSHEIFDLHATTTTTLYWPPHALRSTRLRLDHDDDDDDENAIMSFTFLNGKQ